LLPELKKKREKDVGIRLEKEKIPELHISSAHPDAER